MRIAGVDVLRIALVAALVLPSPSAWAQSFEIADPVGMARDIDLQVQRLVEDIGARDPELAQEIERQARMAERDMKDGMLEHEGLTRDIEQVREVREMVDKMMSREVDGQERRMTEAGGMGMDPAQAQTEFNKVYQEALSRGDAALAEQMKAGFEAFQRGEAFEPTDEMKALYGEVMGPEGGMMHDGPMISEGTMQEFEQWASSDGRTAEEIVVARDMMMERMGNSPMEMFERWSESPEAANIDREMFEQYHQMAEFNQTEFDRYHMEFDRYREFYDYRLEQQQTTTGDTFREVRAHPGHMIDHDQNTETPLVEHHHPIFQHGDGTCHDHATGGQVPC